MTQLTLPAPLLVQDAIHDVLPALMLPYATS